MISYKLVPLVMLAFVTFAGAAIPGANDPKAYTEHDYRRAVLEYNRRTMGEAYIAVGKRDPKWEAQAVAFLDALAETFSYLPAAPQYRRTADDGLAVLETLGKRARDAGCDDPLITYSYGVVLSLLNRPPNQVRPLIERGAAELYTSRYPLNRASAAAHREVKLTPDSEPEKRQAAWERYKDVTLTLIAGWKYKDVDRRIILAHVWDQLEEHGLERQKDFAAALALQGGADPWVSHMIRGRYEDSAAQRGDGAGGNRAREQFQAAWALEPKFPEPAVELIGVSMRSSNRPKEEMRLWFDRAIEGQLDHPRAYIAYLHGLYPGWHGSHDAMYAFGRECAQTMRFDTRVPYQLIVALEFIANDERSPRIWQRPGVYAQVETVLDGMAKHEPKAAHADFYRSYNAAIAWRANEFDEARTRLEAIGERFQPEVFKWLNVMPALAISHIYAMAPPTQAQVKLAEQQAAASEFEAAAKTYQDALTAPRDERAAYFLRGRGKQLQWQQHFVAGEWVDIQPDKDLSGWFPQAGKWEVDEKGGLVGSYMPDGLMLVCQAVFFGKDFVIEGDVELGDFSCDGGIGISPGNPSKLLRAVAEAAEGAGDDGTLLAH